MPYKILYLPGGKYLENIINLHPLKLKTIVFKTKEKAENTIKLYIDLKDNIKTYPDWIRANEIVLPFIREHFEIIEVAPMKKKTLKAHKNAAREHLKGVVINKTTFVINNKKKEFKPFKFKKESE
jgi:hypothetical protein